MTIGSYPLDTTLRNFCQIIDEIETKKKDNSYVSIFQTSFSKYIERKISLRDKIKSKKEYYSLSIYNIVLIKIIDIVRDKTLFLIHVDLTSQENEVHEKSEIQKLNEFYEFFFKNYSEIHKETKQKTIRELIEEETSMFFSLLSPAKLLTPAEIQERKELADKGYSVSDEIKKWLETPLNLNGPDLPTLIKNESIAFLKWADSHPRTASYLAGDVALTYSILLEDKPLEKFSKTLRTILTTRLFLDALGLAPEYEKVESADYLKFRAFAELITYWPQVASGAIVAKNTMNGNYKNFSEFLFGALKETTLNQATQKLARLIPPSNQNEVLILIELIRGENFTTLLTHQRNLSLIRLAGSLRAVLKNRSLVWIQLEVFWKTIFEAKGPERKKRLFTSLFLPLIGTLLAIFSFIFLKKNSSFLASFNSILLFCLSSAFFWLSSFLTRMIDEETGFKAKKRVEKKLTYQEQQKKNLLASHLLESDPEMKGKIQKEVNHYIEDLKKYYALPRKANNEIHVNKPFTVYSEQFQKLLKKKKENLLDQLEKQYAQSKKQHTPSSLVSCFNKVIDLKKLREVLLIEDEEEIDAFIFLLSEDLIEEWLKIKMEQIFKKEFIKIYQINEYEYSKKEHISSNKLKNPVNYLKKSLKSRGMEKDNDSIINTLFDKLIPY